MRIVYCIDKNYIKYAEASIRSVKLHNPTAKFTIVSCEPIEIKGTTNVVIPLKKEDFRFKNETDRISLAAYLKLFLTKLNYSKILYIDADVICQHPLDDLWNTECKYICIAESHKYGKVQANALGLKKYGITGMMLMNIKSLREIGFTEACLRVQQFGDIDPKFWQHDETCINLAMKDKLTFIDKKYNYCHNREYDSPISEEKAVLLHYVGKDKEDMLNVYTDLPKNAVKGKSVAIVGNAESIFSKKNGLEIDRHDVIIRFNKGFIKAPESQGQLTTILFLGTTMSKSLIDSYNATYTINRSSYYLNAVQYTVKNVDRNRLKSLIGKQPSTGFMAIDFCINSGASHIDLYGFDFGETQTFYNPVGYETQHDYDKERALVSEYVKQGLLTLR